MNDANFPTAVDALCRPTESSPIALAMVERLELERIRTFAQYREWILAQSRNR